MKAGRFTRAEVVIIAGAAAVVFTRVFAFSLVLPGFRAYADDLAGATDLLVGAALGAYGLTMALAQFGMGVLSDRIGRRPVLLIGTALFAAGSLWSATADSIHTLLAARLLQGLGGVSSVAMAAVGETVPEERRTTAMAMIGIPAGLGFFLGFALGPLGEGLVGMEGLFVATAILGVVAVLPLASRPLPAHAPPPPATGTPQLPRHVGFAVAALAAAGFAINFAMSEVAFFLSDAPLSNAGLLGALAVAFVVMGGASRAVDRRGKALAPIVACLVLLTAGVALFLSAEATAWAFAGAAALFTAHAVLSAILPSQVSRIAGRSGGRGHGVQLVIAYLGSAVGGVTAGAFADDPLWAAAALAAVAALAVGLVVSSLRPAAVVEPPVGPA